MSVACDVVKKISTGLIVCSVASISYASQGFTGSEHKTIGDNVIVRLPNEPAHKHHIFHLQNGLEITYGELLAMGDFFGVIDMPVSKGKTIEERMQRFIDAYYTIGVKPEWVYQAKLIQKAIHEELAFFEDVLAKGQSPSEAYPGFSGNIDRQYNCATGGGCEGKFWWLKQGRHVKLEMSNYDHFADTAWLAYEAGHRVAMNEAVLAKTTGNIDYLKRAYAMNAFACHFLTDRFASGHIRTPRVELAEHVRPRIVGNLLAKFMHDEDSYGLNVHNRLGQHWRAYGDSNYFEKYAKEHKQHITEALQQSADEIYQAYDYGHVIESHAVFNKLPFADESGPQCQNDIATMFYWDGKSTIYRRWKLANNHECSFTAWWLGWSTLSKLVAIKGLPIHVQGQLATSNYSHEARKAGLITDKDVLAYLMSKDMRVNHEAN